MIGRALGRLGPVRIVETAQSVSSLTPASGEPSSGAGIDVLVNVAGTVGAGGKVEDLSEQNWDFVFAVNCKGSFLFTKDVVPVMKRGGGGSIVNFSSPPKARSRYSSQTRSPAADSELPMVPGNTIAIGRGPCAALRTTAERHAGGRLLSSLEGGYGLEGLAAAGPAHAESGL